MSGGGEGRGGYRVAIKKKILQVPWAEEKRGAAGPACFVSHLASIPPRPSSTSTGRRSFCSQATSLSATTHTARAAQLSSRIPTLAVHLAHFMVRSNRKPAAC